MKYLVHFVFILFFVVLVIFVGVLLKRCFDTTTGRLDEDKIENLKGAK
jgi:hypothetical protein